ncbi:MAG: hypothetical protein WCG27_12635 [Pseudomonadota bacterium]
MKVLERNGLFLLLGLFSLLCAISCSLFVPTLTPAEQKSKTYSVKFTSTDWEKIPPNSSDLALKNKKSSSVIFLNTTCQKYNDADLSHLSDNILSGIEKLQILKKEEVSFSGRKGVKVTASGIMDGLPIFLDFLSVRKSMCLYDFVLISGKKEVRDNDINDFHQFLDGVTIE